MDDAELNGISSPFGSSVSRPIPINRNRSDRLSSSSGTPSPNFAQSAPAPRAPVIGSLRAPSLLGSSMPRLELPPQSPAGRSVGVGANYAQSAPSNHYLLSSKKPILHALQLRERCDSTASSGMGSAGNRTKLVSPQNNKLSELRTQLEAGGAPIFEEEEVDEDGEATSDCFSDAIAATEADGSKDDNLENMTVFKTIKSMSLTDSFKPLSAQMDTLDLNRVDDIRINCSSTKANTGVSSSDNGVNHAKLATATTSLLIAATDKTIAEEAAAAAATADHLSADDDFEEQFDMDDGA